MLGLGVMNEMTGMSDMYYAQIEKKIAKFRTGDDVVCIGESRGLSDSDEGYPGHGWKNNFRFIVTVVDQQSSGITYYFGGLRGNGVREEFLDFASEWDS